VAAFLWRCGYDVAGFDRAEGADILDLAAGASRVICCSSAQVFGIAEGERLPDYFPVDDAHPRRADTAFPAPITRATGRYPDQGAII